MFEQSTLTSGPPTKRLWATCVGVAGEAALVMGAIVAPMVWPQVLPRTTWITALAAPTPPRPLGKPDPVRIQATKTAWRPAFQFDRAVLIEPTNFPAKPLFIEDPPPEMSGGGVPGAVGTGTQGGDPNGVYRSILGESKAPAPYIAEPKRPPVATPAAEVKRVRVGGVVKMAQVLHRVEPQYPALAKQMRTEGTVELVGVIATDGHLKELRVVSGHPLLARAALDAVTQWIYAPTQLNGEPVEVIAPITVTFRFH